MIDELFERELQNTSINGVSLADYIKDNYIAKDQTRWIPVSERLPKAYQKVLVTYEEFNWANDPTTYGVKLISFGGIVDFIAWMPLPEPFMPKECGK